MCRLAWFSPLPPVRSGISAYSAELLPLLAAHHQIDVFVDVPWPGSAGPPQPLGDQGSVSIRSAHDFVWMARKAPYDLIIYQLGNAACHD